MTKFWTEEKDALLRRLYPDAHLASLAFRLGTTVGAMKGRAARLGLRRTVNVKRPWTKRQVEYLKKHYADTPLDEIIAHTGHTQGGIHTKSRQLGLRKSPEFVAGFGRHVSRTPASIAHRFKKGVAPANKGKRIHEFMSPEGIARSAAVRFSKGHKPHTYRPVGYESVRHLTGKGSYIYIKVAKDRPMVPKHRWLWEQAHGPIPADSLVVFRDGDSMHCTLDNLELVTRAEHGRRCIARETPEQRQRRMASVSAALDAIRRRDRARLHFGLEPKSKLVGKW